MSIDYSGLTKMLSAMEDMREELGMFLEKFLLKEAMKVRDKTKLRTPVDTGHLRNSWYITDVIKKGDTLEVYISNNASTQRADGSTHIYASDVEYGHRIVRNGKVVGYVQGYFMATLSLKEIEKKFQGDFDKEFAAFMKRFM